MTSKLEYLTKHARLEHLSEEHRGEEEALAKEERRRQEEERRLRQRERWARDPQRKVRGLPPPPPLGVGGLNSAPGRLETAHESAFAIQRSRSGPTDWPTFGGTARESHWVWFLGLFDLATGLCRLIQSQSPGCPEGGRPAPVWMGRDRAAHPRAGD